MRGGAFSQGGEASQKPTHPLSEKLSNSENVRRFLRSHRSFSEGGRVSENPRRLLRRPAPVAEQWKGGEAETGEGDGETELAM